MLKGNYKIDVSSLNEAERIALQKELFSKGYKWAMSGRQILYVNEKYLMIFQDGDIAIADESFFNKSENILITVSDIMAPQPDSTLRDQFAGQALAALIANPETGGTYENMSKIAYAYADAMLKERNNHV